MNEYHVCGVLLMTRPEHADAVAEAAKALPGVEIHANDGGRMVVTVEGAAYEECAQRMNELAVLSGVASSSLVYHQIDNGSQLEEHPQ